MGKTILPIEDLVKLVQYSRPYNATKEELGGLRQVIAAHNKAHNAELQLLPTANSTNKAMQVHGMISGNAFEAKQANPKAFDTPELRYLHVPDVSGALPPGQVRGNAVFIPPYSGMFQDEDLLKEASLYLQGLGSLGGGAGKAMLGKLQEMYPRARMQLQSLEENGTPEFYRSIGMQPLPQKPGSLPEFYIDAMDDLQLKAQGGPVQMGKGGYTEEKPYTSLAGLTPAQYAKYMRLAAMDDAQKARELQDKLYLAQQAKVRANYQQSYQDQNDTAAAIQRFQNEPGIDFRAAAQQLADQKRVAGQIRAAELAKQYPSMSEGQAPKYNPQKLEEALAAAPVAALQGAVRGLLAGPAFLADIAAIPYNLVSGAIGHAENMTPDMFKASTDWLAKNVPGLKTPDEMSSAVGSLGEMVGMGGRPLTTIGDIGRAVARPFQRSPQLNTIHSEVPMLPSSSVPMLPAPTPLTPKTVNPLEANKSNPAWLRAALDEQYMRARTPEEKTDIAATAEQLFSTKNTAPRLDPSAALALQRSLARRRPAPAPEMMQEGLGLEGGFSKTDSIDDIITKLEQQSTVKPEVTPEGSALQPQLFNEGGPVQKLAGGGNVAKALWNMLKSGSEPMYVVKPKGGNWLSGSVEDSLSGLKKNSGEDAAIQALQRARPGLSAEEARQFTAAPQLTKQEASLNSWIEGPLTKYVKTRMASPDDEVRKLAEQGVLHVDPASLRYGQRQVHPSGEHFQKLAQSPEALKWENAADFAIYPEQARTFKNSVSVSTGRPTIERNPWLANLSDDAPVYGLTQNMVASQDLGFPHLIDELKNALNPESGLPRNLLLTPEAIQNMSMEKAVRRVHDINEWRAAQQAEANAALANKASTVREYPHSEETPNPKGLRWVELKAETKPTGKNSSVDDIADSVKYEEAQRKTLADQLKYEGDTMQNCVGGYCDKVLTGKSRIFSLRDAKGEPHVTVETRPTGYVFSDIANVVGSEKANEMLDRGLSLKDMGKEIGFVPNNDKIVQIKGKQNRAPNEEYLPFVQDFVRNPPTSVTGGGWSDVGDIGNAGLRRTRDVLNDLERKTLEDKGHTFGEYMSDQERQGLQQLWDEGRASGKEGFASGGSVSSDPWAPSPGMPSPTTGTRGYTSNDLHRIIAQLEAA